MAKRMILMLTAIAASITALGFVKFRQIRAALRRAFGKGGQARVGA